MDGVLERGHHHWAQLVGANEMRPKRTGLTPSRDVMHIGGPIADGGVIRPGR